jgi:hypothetical protein
MGRDADRPECMPYLQCKFCKESDLFFLTSQESIFPAIPEPVVAVTSITQLADWFNIYVVLIYMLMSFKKSYWILMA